MTEEQYSEIIATLYHIAKTQEKFYTAFVGTVIGVILASIIYALSR